MTKYEKSLIDGKLPFKLSRSAINALYKPDIHTLDELLRISENQLKKLYRLGRKLLNNYMIIKIHEMNFSTS